MIFIIYTSPSSYCNLAENMLLRITKIKSNLTDLHGMHQLLFTPSHHLLVCCFILPHMYGDKLFKQIPILRLLNICILISDGCKKNVKCLNCCLLQNQLWSFFLFCQIRSESFRTWDESYVQTVRFKKIISEHNMRNEVCTEARQGNQT